MSSPVSAQSLTAAPLHAEGKMKPFARAREVSMEVELKNLDLPFYFAYVPRAGSRQHRFRATVGHGRGDLPGFPGCQTGAVRFGGNWALADLSLRDRTGEPLVSLKQGGLGISKAGILAREFAFSSLSAEGLEAFLSRDGKGTWSTDRLKGKEAPAEPDSEKKKKETPEKKPLVSIAEIRIRDGKFHFADALPAGGL